MLIGSALGVLESWAVNGWLGVGEDVTTGFSSSVRLEVDGVESVVSAHAAISVTSNTANANALIMSNSLLP